jgi:hypothetical protein
MRGCKVAPEILWIGDHMEHLKAKLEHYIMILLFTVSGVFAPEAVTRLIANDLGIQYDEALDVLNDEAAWESGGMVDNTPDFIKADLYMQLLE